MTSSESRRRGSSHHNRVIMVTAKTSASSKLKETADRKSGSSRSRNTSIARKMWDSFESESSSGDDTEHDEREGKKPQSDGESPAIALPARKGGPNRALKSSPAAKSKPAGGAAVGARKSSGSASNDDVTSSRHSQFQSSFNKGDNVSVCLASGGQARGTVSRVSSRGAYDLTLTNGKALKDVDPDSVTFASRRRENSRRNPEHRARSRSGEHNSKGSGEDTIPERKASESGPQSTPPGELSPPPSETAAQSSSLTNENSEKPAEHDLAPVRSSETPENSGAAEQHQQSELSGLSPVASPIVEDSKTLAIGSETDGRNSGTGSTSARGSLPMASTVRHAEGLLKTMFRRKADESVEDTESEKHNRNTLWVKSASRGFFADSHRGDVRKGQDLVDLDDSEDSIIPAISGENEYKTTSKSALDAAGENDLRLSNGLSHGRSVSRRKLAEQSGSTALRSPSLAVKLGNTLRGAIMGKTLLGVHEAHVKRAQGGGLEGNSSSEGTYSTEGSEAGDLLHRNRQRARRRSSRGDRSKGKISRENASEDGDPSDGFDDDVCVADSPLAPTIRVDAPKNLPEVVSLYIEARARMERDLSASGPTFLPRSGNLAAGPREGATIPWVRRQASVDITKEASSTTQLSGQRQPFTEAMLKVGVSETKHSTKQGILLEGDLQKFSPESVRGVRWHKRYFVLYGGSGEFRYYRDHAEASWGRIPLGERGSIPLRLVVKIEQPSDKKYRGSRFNLVVLHKGDGRHPGLHIRPGHETRVTTTKTFKLNASDAQQRLLWVTVIEALMKKHGWGMDVERSRESCVTGHGATSSCGENSAATVELHREGPGDATTALCYDPRLSPLQFETAPSNNMSRRLEMGPNFSRPSLLTSVEDGADVRDSWRRHTSGTVGWSMATFAPSQRDIQIPHSPRGRRESLTTGLLSSTKSMPEGGCHSGSLRPNSRVDLTAMKYALPIQSNLCCTDEGTLSRHREG